MVIPIFFVSHWILSVFMQSFFLHRYAAHKMYTVNKFWEKFFYFMTWFLQGSSYLVPRAYAILHREHHAYSDTEKDPHSPSWVDNPFTMMWLTKTRYSGINTGRIKPEARFDDGTFPVWPALDKFGGSPVGRLAWIGAYTAFYYFFVSAPWQWALLPMTWTMGPLHGAIVNWCGHKYGYRNFDTDDDSRNTLPVDVVTMGELFQNNHHTYSRSANFAQRAFEIDPTYQIMRVMDAIGIIKLLRPRTSEAKQAA